MPLKRLGSCAQSMRPLPLASRARAEELVLEEARSWRARTIGLALRVELEPGHGLLLGRCRSVHTFGMRFDIDILFLDGSGRVLRLDQGVRPRRVRFCRRARAVVEVGSGEGARFARALAPA